jgi:spore coat protein U-like protein
LPQKLVMLLLHCCLSWQVMCYYPLANTVIHVLLASAAAVHTLWLKKAAGCSCSATLKLSWLLLGMSVENLYVAGTIALQCLAAVGTC